MMTFDEALEVLREEYEITSSWAEDFKKDGTTDATAAVVFNIVQGGDRYAAKLCRVTDAYKVILDTIPTLQTLARARATSDPQDYTKAIETARTYYAGAIEWRDRYEADPDQAVLDDIQDTIRSREETASHYAELVEMYETLFAYLGISLED